MSDALEMNVLYAEKRERLGTGTARESRRQDRVIASIYGKDKTQLFITLPAKEVNHLYRKRYFTSTVFYIDVEGTKHKAIAKEVSLHPLTDMVSNIDFTYVKDDKHELAMPVLYEGREKALGVKRGGFLNMIKRKVKVSCDSNNIPQYLVVDVNNMAIGQKIKASEINLPEGCKLLEKPEQIIATMLGKVSKADKEAEAAS